MKSPIRFDWKPIYVENIIAMFLKWAVIAFPFAVWKIHDLVEEFVIFINSY